ncbi:hypothetical protein B0H17DRAFT_1141204 [Mycena rosella]|uniref:Peptidase M20 dimerisation domain-containing protein n=1 Tax=Mycena rosella TaxID=1033263 RepID=A0AAD7GAH1_MYCRO|nr:hypothetical protein B0H17DRAFT_1141204 [Mycena rosella]
MSSIRILWISFTLHNPVITTGADKIAVYLEKTYGRDGFALLLDEGGREHSERPHLCISGDFGKGYFDVKIEIFAPGGHSSVPPRHTVSLSAVYAFQNIGILSQIVVTPEQSLHEAAFPRSGTAFANAQCAVAHRPDSSPELRHLARKALTDDAALDGLKEYLLESDPVVFDAMLKTTQAVDIVYGDTRFYWNLTRHIFRYSHYRDRDDYYNGLHTVNEAARGEAVVEHARFFKKFILNSDETNWFA